MNTVTFTIPTLVALEAEGYKADHFRAVLENQDPFIWNTARRGWTVWVVDLDNVRDSAEWYSFLKSAIDDFHDNEHTSSEDWRRRSKEQRARFAAATYEALAAAKSLLVEHGATPEMFDKTELWQRLEAHFQEKYGEEGVTR